MKHVNIEKLSQLPLEQTTMEIVERKGQGHPDYLIDGASEAVSMALCQYYLKTLGVTLHHNVDKGLLVGGRSNPVFGGGEVVEPINIIVAGRATTQVLRNDKIIPIPIGSIALEAIKQFLEEKVRFLDVKHNVICNYMIKQSSFALIKNFENSSDMPLSNDTSFGVSYAPLSQTERLVMETERFLDSKRIKQELPSVGEDIKVMGLRRNKQITLTIAAPQISSLTPDLEYYLSVKEEVETRILNLAAKFTNYPITVYVNTADKPQEGNVYLTVTGTSAEQGDDGNTGRGNRINGLITPYRTMSMEATAGKNPINHVGKIYNVLANKMASKIYEEIEGIEEVYVRLLSQIGKPIDRPLVTDVEIILKKGHSLNTINAEINSIVDEQISNIRSISADIIDGKAMLF